MAFFYDNSSHTGPEGPQLKSAVEHQRVVALINPNATISRHEHHQGNLLGKLFNEDARSLVPENIIYSHEDSEVTISDLREKLQEGDLLVTIGGDGTNKLVTEFLCDPDNEVEIQQIPVLAIGGGNSNNAAGSFNSFFRRQSPDKLIKKGVVVPIRPLFYRVESAESGETSTELGINYVGHGYTGRTMERLEDPTYRAQRSHSLAARFIKDFLVSLDEIKNGGTFKVDRDGEISEYMELTYANGPKMARLGRNPIKFSEPYLTKVEMPDDRAMTLFSTITRFAMRQLEQDPVESDEFKTLGRLCVQIDGELRILQSNDRVSVGIHNVPLQVVTLRPKRL